MTIVVPFAAGGPGDALARPLGQKMSEALGQPVVIENKPGANGLIGTTAVARARPDGYTMLVTTGAHTSNPAVVKSMPYDALRDFIPITQLVRATGMVLVVRPAFPAKTVSDFVALARSEPQKFTYGHAGLGNLTHVSMELFKKLAGFEVLPVPYKGTSEIVRAVLQGDVDMAIIGSIAATPQIEQGALRGLAITGPRRSSVLPDVPTFQEAGYQAIDLQGYYGMWFPAGTPRADVELIHATVKSALETDTLRKVLSANGLEVVASPPDEFARFLETDLAHQASIIRQIGIEPR